MKKLSFLFALLLTTFSFTQAQIVSTLAGTGTSGSANSTLPSFNNPVGVCSDPAGNIYVADASCRKIRKITPSGVVSTLAGSGAVGSVDGMGNLASFNTPYGICINPANGNLIVSDRANHTIRQITPAGVVTTIAGIVGMPGLINSPGLMAKFDLPSGVWANAAGDIFVGDYNNFAVRKITSGGVISTFANIGGFTVGITGDVSGNIYAVDRYSGTGGLVKKITSVGVVSTYAIGFNEPLGICIDATGNLFVSNFTGNTISKISNAATPVVSTFITINKPIAICINTSGDFFVSQYLDHKLSKVTPAGVISPYSGTGVAGCDDSNNSIAMFNSPTATCVDGAGNVFVADQLNHLVRKITPAGVVSTVAGTAGVAGYADGTGTAAKFNEPVGIAIDAQDNLYVSEYRNHTVRKITPAGVVTTLAGTAGVSGAVDATGIAASFYNPGNLCVDDLGNVYLADRSNMKIRKISPLGVVTTFAGTGTAGAANGTRLAATFNYPSDITLDKSGNFYVSDEYSHQIRKISLAGMVSTVAGSGIVGNTDGPANTATFDRPSGIYADANCNLYVTQYNGHKVRKIDANGTVSTYAGSATTGFVNGIGTSARFYFAFSVDGDTQGNLYIADIGNHAVRKIITSTNACAWQLVSAGAAHTMAIKPDGTLWGWGFNTNGQLGIGNNSNQNQPQKIGNDNDWVSVSAGIRHTLGLKADGSLWAWGQNFYGELGDGTNVDKTTPIKVGIANDWAKIEAGEGTSYAIKQGGSLLAWGRNDFGQLGDGTGIAKNVPTTVVGIGSCLMVSTKYGHVLAIKSDGTLWSWGYNLSGQIGDGTNTNRLSPFQISSNIWKNISAGGEHSLAIKNDGTLWAWGNNANLQLGLNNNTNMFIPTLVNSTTDWVDISAGFQFSTGLKAAGSATKTIWVWGSQNQGQFGNGTNTTILLIPTQIGSASNFANTLAGAFYRITISDTGELLSTGDNGFGQIGNGNNTSVNIPTPVSCISFLNNRCYVNNSATGANNGMSWVNAFVSLDDALTAARSYGVTEIWVAKGTYKPSAFPYSITGNPTLTNRDKTFHLVDGVKMYGGFVGTETAINQRVNIFTDETILSGDLLGNDLPFQLGSNLTSKVDNCYHVVLSIKDCKCTLLDGFFIKGGQANVNTFIEVEGNFINRNGGGGVCLESSPIEIYKVNFEENFADYGGGLYNNNSNSKITYSIFNFNRCEQYGGGLNNSSSNPIITNSVFCYNTSLNFGGAVSNGGSLFYPSNLQFINTTFNNNAAPLNVTSAGVLNANSSCTINAKNCIFWNSGNGVLDNGASSTITNSIILGTTYPGNSSADPLFTNGNSTNGRGIDGNWRTPDDGLTLQNCSPAINGGDNLPVENIPVDLKNETRIKTCVVDMGAYENSGAGCGLVQSVANGNWIDRSTWNIGRPPIETENPIISTSNTVALDNAVWVNNLITQNSGIPQNNGTLLIGLTGQLNLGGGNTSACPPQICGQVWMAKNLDVSTYRDGTPIPQVSSSAAWAGLTTGAWCYYNNDPLNGPIYGKLYNWYAVNDSRGLAPTGWHVASDAEWTTVSNCLGGDFISGGALKEIGTVNWNAPNTGATNSSGFKALPGGYRDNTTANFLLMKSDAVFWTSTPENATDAKGTQATYNNTVLLKGAVNRNFGFSVRCVKD